MCTNSLVGNIGIDVAAAAADVASGGSLTPALIAAGLSAGGQVVSAEAQRQALNKQDQLTAANILKQGDLNKQAEGDVSKTIKQVSASNPAAAKAQQTAAYDRALEQAQSEQQSAVPGVPGASKAYKASAAGANASADQYINAAKEGLAGTNAPTLQRIGESQDIAGTASDLGLLSGQAQRENYASDIAVQSVRQNPWLQGLGLLMQGAGSGLGSYTGWKAAGAAKSGLNADNYVSMLRMEQ